MRQKSYRAVCLAELRAICRGKGVFWFQRLLEAHGVSMLKNITPQEVVAILLREATVS